MKLIGFYVYLLLWIVWGEKGIIIFTLFYVGKITNADTFNSKQVRLSLNFCRYMQVLEMCKIIYLILEGY
jgi:hypothetical protein